MRCLSVYTDIMRKQTWNIDKIRELLVIFLADNTVVENIELIVRMCNTALWNVMLLLVKL